MRLQFHSCRIETNSPSLLSTGKSDISADWGISIRSTTKAHLQVRIFSNFIKGVIAP